MTRWSVIGVLFLTGCSGDAYDVEVRFADPADQAVAVRTQVAVVTSCDLQELGADPENALLPPVEIADGEPTRSLGDIPSRTLGLYARAIDENCRVIAAGCADQRVSNGGGGTLTVVLRSVDSSACEPGLCRNGRCTDVPDAALIDSPDVSMVDADLGVPDADLDQSTCTPGEDCELPVDQQNTCVRGAIECRGGESICVPQLIVDLENPCRAPTGGCEDVADFCDGTSPACVDRQADGSSCPSGTLCADGVCQVCEDGAPCLIDECTTGVERCTGVARCEETGFVANGTACGDPGFVCDGGGNCVEDVACGEPCALPREPCQTAIVQCDGGAARCTRVGSRPDGSACEALSAPSACEGEGMCQSGACVRVFAPGRICGPSTGECRRPSVCENGSAVCPSSTDLPNGQSCGDPEAGGACDAPDECRDGVCMANELPPGTPCGPVNGECGVGLCSGGAECDINLLDGDACRFDLGACREGLCGVLLISEVGQGVGDMYDFIEFYNSSDAVFNTSTCSAWVGGLRVYDFPDVDVEPGAFVLLASSKGEGPVPDARASFTIDLSGVVQLRCEADTLRIVDAVAWGSAGGEGTPLPSLPLRSTADGIAWQSWERKACVASTAETMASEESEAGNSFDSEDNTADFVRQEESSPQGFASPLEERECTLS
ncbi:MAG: lamin tail domain-containing protein [Myxococcota bacterium]